jgi:hypothetical protein
MTGRKRRLMTLIDKFTRSRASANLTIPCHPGQAVQIEPGLRRLSPKNGKNEALAIVMILGAFGSALYHPAFGSHSMGRSILYSVSC